MSVADHLCPNCLIGHLAPFYEAPNVPVHSVLLMETKQQALDFPRGDIRLALCGHCGFISNMDFNPELHNYAGRYEATQSYSPTFNHFHEQLAQRLIDTYDLHGKVVLEIGCGHGEFLIMLCDMGQNQGIGFDPAYDAARIQHPAKDRIEFIADFYSPQYASYRADFYCCKMTLEHIAQTAGFMAAVRQAIGVNDEARIFFQIPNATYVLRDGAFWDVYYEHCSYFTAQSLQYLFTANGFEVLDVFTDYDDQYLMIEARPTENRDLPSQGGRVEQVAEVSRDTEQFVAETQRRIAQWRDTLQRLGQTDRRVVIWGSGSKGVTFLNVVGGGAIDYAVDINPVKRGTFMAGTGQEIIGPADLPGYAPDVVIVMNPIYLDEIGRQLNEFALRPALIAVDDLELLESDARINQA